MPELAPVTSAPQPDHERMRDMRPWWHAGRLAGPAVSRRLLPRPEGRRRTTGDAVG